MATPEGGTEPASPARVYDYLLGGVESYAPDRALADRLTGGYAGVRALARQNRAFILKAARWTAAMRGTGQFLDVGCGYPAVPAVHEAVRQAFPLAVVAYVDRDPEVVLNTRTAYQDVLGLVVAEGDAENPAKILASDTLQGAVDLSRPVCVVFGGTLSSMTPHVAREAVAGFTSALAPGSAVIISCVSYADVALGERIARIFSGAGTWNNHDTATIASFFGAAGLRLLHGRLMDVSCWPACPAEGETRAAAAVLGGIGIKD